MTTTIEELAQLAKVHNSTVSRALNDDPRISTQTKQRIRKLAEELDYHSHAVARSLVLKRTKTLELVVPRLNIFQSYISSTTLTGIGETVEDMGYDLLWTASHGKSMQKEIILRTIRERRVEGLFLFADEIDESCLYEITLESMPLVLVNTMIDKEGAHCVSSDNTGGAYQATEHLISLGHRRIGYISDSSIALINLERQKGYELALEEHNIVFDQNLVSEGATIRDTNAGYRAMSKLLDLHEPPTAVFAASDVLAIGAIKTIKERGLKIPDDIAIVGFDDMPSASLIAPPLTTVRQNGYKIGVEAAKMLLKLIACEEVHPEKLRIERPR